MVKSKAKRAVAKQPKMKTKTSKSVVAFNTTSRSSAPVLSSKQGQTTVGHREVATESIANSVSYSINGTYALQPAISTYSHGTPIGKWLPGIAKEYDNYEFVSLKAHYVPVCSTLTPGLVVMTYDPNPNTSAPATFTDARNAMCSVSGPVREKITLDLSSYVKGRKLLTRTRVVYDYALYDAGRLFVSTTSGDTTANVGYLEMEYSVRLSNPQSEGGTTAVESVVALSPTYLSVGANVIDGGVETFGTNVGSGLKVSTIFTATIAPGPTRYGDTSLISFALAGGRSGHLQFQSSNNILHSTSNTGTINVMAFNRLGLWRVRAIIPGNWQNFAMFGAEMLRWPKGSSPLSTTPLLATKAVLGLSGNTSFVPSGFGVTRGFKTVEVGGTENDDLALEYDELISVEDILDNYAFSVGMRNETAVGENLNTGSYTYNSAQGRPRFEVTYLGQYS